MFFPSDKQRDEDRRRADERLTESKRKLRSGIQERTQEILSGENRSGYCEMLGEAIRAASAGKKLQIRSYIQQRRDKLGGYAPIQEGIANRAIQALDEGDYSHPAIADYLRSGECDHLLG